jgi:hypothetical protein
LQVKTPTLTVAASAGAKGINLATALVKIALATRVLKRLLFANFVL